MHGGIVDDGDEAHGAADGWVPVPVDDVRQGVRRQLLQVINDRLGGSGKVVTQQRSIADDDLRRFRRAVPPVFGVIGQVEGEAAVPAIARPQCFRAR